MSDDQEARRQRILAIEKNQTPPDIGDDLRERLEQLEREYGEPIEALERRRRRQGQDGQDHRVPHQPARGEVKGRKGLANLLAGHLHTDEDRAFTTHHHPGQMTITDYRALDKVEPDEIAGLARVRTTPAFAWRWLEGSPTPRPVRPSMICSTASRPGSLRSRAAGEQRVTGRW